MKLYKIKRITKEFELKEKVHYIIKNSNYKLVQNMIFYIEDKKILFNQKDYLLVSNNGIVNISEEKVVSLFGDVLLETYQLIYEEFSEKMKNKKGILYFDMDQTIYDFLGYKNQHPDYNQNTIWCSKSKNFPKFKLTEEEVSRHGQGINLDVIKYLKLLKKDYLLISNTSWYRGMINNVHEMNLLFDFYGNGAGTSISSQTSLEFPLGGSYYMVEPRNSKRELMNEIDDYVNNKLNLNGYRKAAVNEIFYKMLNDSGFDVNKLRLVQFEDEFTGTIHITDFVNLTRGLSGKYRPIEELVNGLDTVSSNPEHAQQRIKEQQEFYEKKGINFYSLPLGIHSDGAITWCKENL